MQFIDQLDSTRSPDILIAFAAKPLVIPRQNNPWEFPTIQELQITITSVWHKVGLSGKPVI